MKICGIYGFEISEPIEFSSYRIEPLYTNASIAAKLTKDRTAYNLTAVLISDRFTDQGIFEVSSALTFIEHSQVLITSPRIRSNPDWSSEFSSSLDLPGRKSGGGATVGDDLFHPGSREKFLQCLFSKLKDKIFLESTGFDFMYYKCVESCRLSQNIVDIMYFLLFSGLETYARTDLGMKTERNTSIPISKLLRKHGFDFKEEYASDLTRSVSTYTHLRNGLFHQSAQEVTVNKNGIEVSLSIYDYWGTLSSLVPLVIMKAIDFDDGHINWDRWRTRIAFSTPSV